MALKTFEVDGMHCPSCKALIEDVASDVPGVLACTVDGDTHKGSVEYDERFDPELLKKEVESLGEYHLRYTV